MTTAETWAKRVEEWQASAQTSVAYCEGREFTAGGLRHWAHRFRVQAGKVSRAVTRPPVKLARVRAVRGYGSAETIERPAADSGVAVVIGRARIVVGRGFDPSTLATVLAVLLEGRDRLRPERVEDQAIELREPRRDELHGGHQHLVAAGPAR